MLLLVALGISILFYSQFGAPRSVADAPPQTPEQWAALAERLTARGKDQPDDLANWVSLARANSTLGRPLAAAAAYEKAVALAPEQAQLYAEYAFALVAANGRRVEGKPEELVAIALRLDPNNEKALALAGTAAFNRKNYSAAADYWGRLLKQMPPGSEGARTVADSIERARSAEPK